MTPLADIVAWLDRTLNVAAFRDVSNNGLQIDRTGAGVSRVACAVDASLATIEAAAAAGAELLVVHHGISWGGGIARITGGTGRVIRAAIQANLALYAVHLPLDAHARYGNNFELARFLGLDELTPAFVYHGETIGVIGRAADGRRIGVCSGGAGEFAPDARALGCDLYVTGEASWGDVIAAENCGMPMVCAGHYETETFGPAALARALGEQFALDARFLPRPGARTLSREAILTFH